MKLSMYASTQSQYLAYCKEERSLSENTVLAYQQDLTCFARFWASNPEETRFIGDLVLDYLRHLRETRKLQPTTVRRRMLTIRMLSNWLEKTGQITRSPFDKLDITIQLPQRLPRPVDRRDVVELLAKQRTRINSPRLSHAKRKNMARQFTIDTTTYLAIKIMVSTGIRVGELTSIRVHNISDRGHKIRICGKGNRERNVYIVNASLLSELQDYLQNRKGLATDHDYLLINRSGKRLTTQALRRRLKTLSTEIGANPPLTPHRFRHSAATYLIEEGVDIRFVQRLLGHSSIATTEIYTRVSDSSLLNAMQSADPLEKLKLEYG